MTEPVRPVRPDPRLVALVETWKRACDDFVALVRDLPAEDLDRPTDLPGWSVRDNLAHTTHLEAVLAGAPEETVEVPEADHVRSPMSVYTEQGVIARRGRDVEALLTELEDAVATRYAALLADPPVDGTAPPPRTLGGIGWDTRTLLSNRPLDVWMHEQDVRRAVGRPGGYDSPAAAHVIGVLGRSLPLVVGKRVAPPAGTTVRLDVPEAGRSWSATVGDDGRAVRAEEDAPATTRITLGAEDFVVLAGGRRPVSATSPEIEGDARLAGQVLSSLAVTP